MTGNENTRTQFNTVFYDEFLNVNFILETETKDLQKHAAD